MMQKTNYFLGCKPNENSNSLQVTFTKIKYSIRERAKVTESSIENVKLKGFNLKIVGFRS